MLLFLQYCWQYLEIKVSVSTYQWARVRHEISGAHTELTFPGAKDSYSLFPRQQGSSTHQEMILDVLLSFFAGVHLIIAEPISLKAIILSGSENVELLVKNTRSKRYHMKYCLKRWWFKVALFLWNTARGARKLNRIRSLAQETEGNRRNRCSTMIVNMIIRIAIWFSHTYTDMKTIEYTESNKNKTTMRVTVAVSTLQCNLSPELILNSSCSYWTLESCHLELGTKKKVPNCMSKVKFWCIFGGISFVHHRLKESFFLSRP